MGERLVLCGEADRGGEQDESTLRLALTGPHGNINLRLQDISRRMVANVPSLITDLVEIATYILCADGAVSRGGDARERMGADWRRQFRFIIPVRMPDRWSSPDVVDALTDVLGFLSEDEFRFEFTRQHDPPPFQNYLDFSHEGPESFQPDEIALFSGGMDSLGGAIEELATRHHRVVLVSHDSSSKIFSRQKYLAEELIKRFASKVLHVPVHVTKHKDLRTVEYTQRTRSFLFAALAAAVGKILGRRRIRFYENGIVSFILPISGQVLGTRATRTTHPRVLQDLERFLTILFEDEMTVDNPFAWKTKTDVATIIEGSSHGDLLRHSVSCSQVHSMTRLHTHCGTCFQCLDRRFATLAAGLEAHDPAEMYRIDLLTGEREEGADRTMAESYVRRALEFRRMTPEAFLGRYAGEISRAVYAFPGMPPDEVARSAFDLHKRHGDDVHSVLAGGVRRHADGLVSRTLPSTCILRMAVGEYGRDFDDSPIRPPAIAASDDALQPGPRDFSQSAEIRLALDENTHQVLIRGVPRVKGATTYALFHALVLQRRSDLQAGRAPENYEYMSARSLAPSLMIEEQSLRQIVSRFRRKAANLFVDHLGYPLGQDDIIETRGWKGYRINPDVRLVAATEIEVKGHGFPAQSSQVGKHNLEKSDA